MTLKDLIDQLSEIAEELGPDTEVRLASQPRWPFEWSIAGLSTLNPSQEEIDEIRELMLSTPRDDWPEDAEEQLRSLEQAPRFVWICEGSQIGYTTDRHWDEL